MTRSVVVVGYGTIGAAVAAAFKNGIYGLSLAGIAVRDPKRPRRSAESFPVFATNEASDRGEIVVDCANPSAFEEIALPAVAKGRTLVTVNSGALQGYPGLIEQARRTGAKIVVPSGAILGLDAVRAAAEGTISSISITTRKPPKSLADAPSVIERNIDLDALSEPLLLFSGNALDAIRAFPQNVNVAATLSFAGIGPEKTYVEVWADPALERNTHLIKVVADAGSFSMEIASAPDPIHPRTGKISAQSVVACLRSMEAVLQIGS